MYDNKLHQFHSVLRNFNNFMNITTFITVVINISWTSSNMHLLYTDLNINSKIIYEYIGRYIMQSRMTKCT